MKIIEEVKFKKETTFMLSRDGTLIFKGRLCIPNNEEKNNQILAEVHNTPYSVYPKLTKMYREQKKKKKTLWWNGMKRDVAEYVSKCLTCQLVKVEHQRHGKITIADPVARVKMG